MSAREKAAPSSKWEAALIINHLRSWIGLDPRFESAVEPQPLGTTFTLQHDEVVSRMTDLVAQDDAPDFAKSWALNWLVGLNLATAPTEDQAPQGPNVAVG
jgi:hypothetical protein